MIHVYKVLQQADELKTKKEKIEFLQKNKNFTVDKILYLTYNENIEFALPDSEPPFKRSEFDEYSNLHSEIKRIERIFVKGKMPNLSKIKMEQLFLQVLEYVDKDDAKLLVGMLQKKLPFKSLNRKLIVEARPELFE